MTIFYFFAKGCNFPFTFLSRFLQLAQFFNIANKEIFVNRKNIGTKRGVSETTRIRI